MSPHRVDPSVDYKRLHELSEEFSAHWNKLHAFYLDAAIGFAAVRQRVEAEQQQARAFVRGSELDSEEFQDTRRFSYAEILSNDFCASGIHEATQGEVKDRNAPDGANFATLGQLCIASFYDFWNDYLRREYVIAKGKLDRREKDDGVIKAGLREYASHDLWGDLYYLRTSIVHNQGVATSDVTKCKLLRWFQPGEEILLTPQHMRALFVALLKYRNDLFAEQFPEHYIQLDVFDSSHVVDDETPE
jgi:hypothetical protein